MAEAKKLSKWKQTLYILGGAVAGYFAFNIIGMLLGLVCGFYIAKIEKRVR